MSADSKHKVVVSKRLDMSNEVDMQADIEPVVAKSLDLLTALFGEPCAA
ncbi:MAG: hypothetical protein RXS42_06165 [Nitrososphaeria archaeon]